MSFSFGKLFSSTESPGKMVICFSHFFLKICKYVFSFQTDDFRIFFNLLFSFLQSQFKHFIWSQEMVLSPHSSFCLSIVCLHELNLSPYQPLYSAIPNYLIGPYKSLYDLLCSVKIGLVNIIVKQLTEQG